MKDQEFYCVKCRKKVHLPAKEIGVVFFHNKKRGEIPALMGHCRQCDTKVTKFIKESQVPKMIEKFGEY